MNPISPTPEMALPPAQSQGAMPADPAAQEQIQAPGPQMDASQGPGHAFGDGHPDDDEPSVAQAIDDHLNQLDEKQQAFVTEHLTPEIALVASIIGGDPEIYQALLPYTDQSVMLVPMPRDQAMQMMQQNNAPQGASPAPTPGAQPVPPQGPQRPPMKMPPGL